MRENRHEREFTLPRSVIAITNVPFHNRPQKRKLVVIDLRRAEDAIDRAAALATFMSFRMLTNVVPRILLHRLVQPAALRRAELDVAEFVHVQ